MERLQVGQNQGAQVIRPTAAPIARTQQAKAADPLRPVSKPNDQTGDILSFFSDASASINSAYQSYDQQRQQDGSQDATDALAAMTFDEAKAAVKAGEIGEHENPYYVSSFKRQFGLSHAARSKRQWINDYQTGFDPNNGNIDEFIADRIGADQETYLNDPDIYDGIRKGMEGFPEKLRNVHSERMQEMNEADVKDRFGTLAFDAAQKAIATGQSPSDAIRALYDPHKKNLGLSYSDMDDVVLQVARRYAEQGDTATVRDILSTERKASDGTNLGSFLTRGTTAQDATTVTSRADQVLRRDTNAAQAELKANTDESNANLKAGYLTQAAAMKSRADLGELTTDDIRNIPQMVALDVISWDKALTWLAGDMTKSEKAGRAKTQAFTDMSEGIIAQATKAEQKRKKQEALPFLADYNTKADQGTLTPQEIQDIEDGSMGEGAVLSRSEALALIDRNRKSAFKVRSRDDRDIAKNTFGAAVASAMQSGKVHQLSDQTYRNLDGTDSVFKVQDAIQSNVDTVLGSMDQSGRTPAEMGMVLSQMGVDALYVPWETVMSNGHVAIHHAASTLGKDGKVELPETAMAGFTMWKELSDNPALRERHVKDDAAADVYATAEILERAGGMDPGQALLAASGVGENGKVTPLTREQTGHLYAAIDDLIEGGTWRSTAANDQYIQNSVRVLSRTYMALGLGAERAVEAATERFEATHTMLFGKMVATNNRHIPPDFEENAQPILEEFAERTGTDIDDLTLYPVRNNGRHWIIGNKDMPMAHPEFTGALTVRDIMAGGDKERSDKAQETIDIVNRHQTTRANQAIFDKLPSEHKENHVRHLPDTKEYGELQKRFGTELYPEGGLIQLGAPRAKAPVKPKSGLAGSKSTTTVKPQPKDKVTLTPNPAAAPGPSQMPDVGMKGGASGR